MGANAQTTVPTFTTGQVLTADQQNQSARTGVPVFATTITRDAAFGGTGEKTLAEGQLAYVEGTGLQSYNGSSWVTWGAAPSAGLTLISATTIGTAVASVTVSNAFSATYDNYFITINGGVASTDNAMSLTLGATTTGYYYGGSGTTYATNTLSADSTANGSSWVNVASGSANSLNSMFYLFDPYNAKSTHVAWWDSRSATASASGNGSGYLANTTSYTAFTLTVGTGTVTGGTIRVYGLQNS